MIISFPTALYKNVIPGPGGSGNVTWLISSTDPPRSVESFQQIPPAESIRRRDPPTFTDRQRRDAMGDAVFSLSQGSQSIVGTAVKQFEIGQILEFEDETLPETTITPLPAMVDIQQNTNLLDLSALGLTDSEIDRVTQESEKVKKQIEDEIVSLKRNVDDMSISINENQKRINEADKTLDAATVINDEAIVNKMNLKISELTEQRIILVEELNAYNERIGVKYDQLLKVIQLVR
jgi:hypothetical protein